VTSRFQLRQAARCIHHGGIIAYPTESVFGLGCDPLDELAVTEILLLKQRPVEKGLILIASHIAQLLPFVDINNKQLEKLNSITPAPTTWLTPASSLAPDWITGKHQKIAVRITQHPIAKKLCQQTGHPLVSTSANVTGKKPAKTLLKTKFYFSDMVDYYVPGSIQGFANPSQIRDLDTDEIIRAS